MLKSRMLIAPAITMACMLALSACNSSTITPTTAPSAAQTSTPSATQTTAPTTRPSASAATQIGIPVPLGGMTLTVTSAKKATLPKRHPAAGKVFYLVELECMNSGQKNLLFRYDYADFTIRDANGVQARSQQGAGKATVIGTGEGARMAAKGWDVSPDSGISTEIYFEVPQDLKALKLVYAPVWSTKELRITLTA